MSDKATIWLGVSIGSAAGEAIPALFGAGYLSMWGILTGAVGALAGIWLAWRIVNG